MNNITERLNRSWQLFKRSIFVLRDNPKLLLFPIVIALFTVGLAIFFFTPVAVLLFAPPHWAQGSWFAAVAENIGFVKVQTSHGTSFNIQPLGSLILGIVYLVNMFFATLASVAFNSQIMEALNGRPVSLTSGLRLACTRWKAVLFWSLLAGIVGLIIRNIEQRFALFGRLVAGMIGLAWSVAAIFAIPILIAQPEISNPFTILGKSATTLKRTWGEMLAGYIGMSGINLLVLWFSILSWVGTGALAIGLRNPWLLLLYGVPWLAGIVVYSYVASIASKVYLCALYIYAETGNVSGYFDSSMMSMGWKFKKT